MHTTENNTPARLEVAVDHPEAAFAAAEGGAERLELGASLADGGLTPSLGFAEWCLAELRVPVHCLLRPRAGNFCYSRAEMAVVERDLHAFKKAGVHGVVFGALNGSGGIDTEALRRVVEQAPPMRVCFHRAFDVCADREEALETLIACGVDLLLTSGGAASLPQGADEVTRIARQAAGRIEIMGGAGVRVANVGELWRTLPVDTLHASLRSPWSGAALADGSAARMGGRDGEPLHSVRVEDVRAMVRQLGPERVFTPPLPARSPAPGSPA